MKYPLPSTQAELTVGSESQPALLTEVNRLDSLGQPFLFGKAGETNFVLRSVGPERQMAPGTIYS